MRNHDPILIEEFNGLFIRGGADSCPPDHWPDCNNVKFIQSGFRTRPGLTTRGGYPNVLKVYNFLREGDDPSILVLDINGNIFHEASPTPFTPILTLPGMTDFGLCCIGTRAYISPFVDERGMAGEFVYVYLGLGDPARKAAGNPPVDADGALSAAVGSGGNVTAGFHIFGVVYETDTGFLSAPGPNTFASITTDGTTAVDLSNVCVSPSSSVIARFIVATKAIINYDGNQNGYQFFFVPNGKIDDNSGTSISVNFFDSDLLDDASHLIDILSEIPAGVGLTTYHNRMILYATNDQQSIGKVSEPGEPEAFNSITGFFIIPTDAHPISNAQEYRDILYVFKAARTFGIQDNGGDPSSWNVIELDQGLGAPIHGISTVLNLLGATSDFLIIANYSGIYLFNGSYIIPELSWKIADYWSGFNFSDFFNIQTCNDTINKVFYTIMPNKQVLLYADYSNGLDIKNIRFSFWTFPVEVTSICLTDFDKLIIGSLTGM